jgi:hypothetical protein
MLSLLIQSSRYIITNTVVDLLVQSQNKILTKVATHKKGSVYDRFNDSICFLSQLFY